MCGWADLVLHEGRTSGLRQGIWHTVSTYGMRAALHHPLPKGHPAQWESGGAEKGTLQLLLLSQSLPAGRPPEHGVYRSEGSSLHKETPDKVS